MTVIEQVLSNKNYLKLTCYNLCSSYIMVTIDIGCVVVNELFRLQSFTSMKDQNMMYSLKFSNIFLRTKLEFEYS